MSAPVYSLTLHKTYYDQGFFNIGVELSGHVRRDSGPVTLLLGESPAGIAARVNREANQNGTPRVHGGAALRNWLQKHFRQGERIDVVIETSERLRLRRP